MDSAEARLALDVGQSTTKARAIGSAQMLPEFVLPCVRTDQPVLPQLAEIIGAGIAHVEAAHPGTAIRSVALGVSGLTPAEGDAAQLHRVLRPTPVRELRLTHDAVTGYLGALGNARGAVVAAGTGAVTLGVGKDRVARVDGWGLLGDAGSGYWMGREALHAALRGYDGRGPDTALLERVRGRFPDIESAYIQVQNDPQTVRLMASFAQDAAELAADDDVADSICRRAATKLAHSTVTALRRVGEDAAGHAGSGEDSAPRVAAIGGLFRCGLIAEEFRRHIERAAPQARLVTPGGRGLDGVSGLFGITGGHPLSQHISVEVRTL